MVRGLAKKMKEGINMKRKIAIMFTFSVAFYFVMVSLVQSDDGNLNLGFNNWGITYDGTDESLEWIDAI